MHLVVADTANITIASIYKVMYREVCQPKVWHICIRNISIVKVNLIYVAEINISSTVTDREIIVNIIIIIIIIIIKFFFFFFNFNFFFRARQHKACRLRN